MLQDSFNTRISCSAALAMNILIDADSRDGEPEGAMDIPAMPLPGVLHALQTLCWQNVTTPVVLSETYSIDDGFGDGGKARGDTGNALSLCGAAAARLRFWELVVYGGVPQAATARHVMIDAARLIESRNMFHILKRQNHNAGRGATTKRYHGRSILATSVPGGSGTNPRSLNPHVWPRLIRWDSGRSFDGCD